MTAAAHTPAFHVADFDKFDRATIYSLDAEGHATSVGVAYGRVNAHLFAEAPAMAALLRDCASALETEVAWAENEDHPIIKDHAKTARQARALLARLDGTGA